MSRNLLPHSPLPAQQRRGNSFSGTIRQFSFSGVDRLAVIFEKGSKLGTMAILDVQTRQPSSFRWASSS